MYYVVYIVSITIKMNNKYSYIQFFNFFTNQYYLKIHKMCIFFLNIEFNEN